MFLRLSLVVITLISSNFQVDAQMGWRHGVGGSQDDQSLDLTFDEHGNYYMVGSIAGDAILDPQFGLNTDLVYGSVPNGIEMYIAKYNNNGVHIWSKNFSGSASKSGATGIVYDGQGNLYVTGTVQGSAAGPVDFDPSGSTAIVPHNAVSNDVFLAKYDTAGNFSWVQLVATGGMDAVPTSIVLDTAGYIIVGGSFEGQMDFDPTAGQDLKNAVGKKDLFVSSFADDGTRNWVIHIGSTDDDIANNLSVDATGLYLYGYFAKTNIDFDPIGSSGITLSSSVGSFTGFFGKYNFNGECLWANAIEGYSEVKDLEIDKSGNVIISGGFFLTTDFDPGPGVANQTSGSGGSFDPYIAKYDASGNYIWAEAFEGAAGLPNIGANIVLDTATNDIVFSVNFTNTVDFGIGSPDLRLALGNYDIFLMRLDGAGNKLKSYQIGGIGVEKITKMYWVAPDSVILIGNFNGTSDFDPCTGDTVISSMDNIFMATYGFENCPIPVAFEEPNRMISNSLIQVYPNPSSDKLVIMLEELGTDTEQELIIMDLTGRIIYSKKMNKNNLELSVSDWNSGLYFVSVADKSGLINTQKFLVE